MAMIGQYVHRRRCRHEGNPQLSSSCAAIITLKLKCSEVEALEIAQAALKKLWTPDGFRALR